MLKSGGVEIDLAESGHLRPLAATRLEVYGAATCGHLQPLACGHSRPLGTVWSGHLRPLAWNFREGPLAATGLETNWLERPLAATCGHLLGKFGSGHLRPLEWLQVAASGCHALASEASCGTGSSGHLQPIEWLQVLQAAANGCEWLHAGRNTWPELAS